MIKEKIGRIWLKIFKKYDSDILINQFSYFIEFYLNFLGMESTGVNNDSNNSAYDLNMCACDFFYYLIIKDDNYNKLIISNESVYNIYNKHLSKLINLLLNKISLRYGTKDLINEMDQEQIIDIDDVVNTSVRKSSALLLQFLAATWPEYVFNNSQQIMEQGLNSSNHIEK